jgi:diguanylate cyclase (GGDEF)-like protein/PAS domain S-box-containing protein
LAVGASAVAFGILHATGVLGTVPLPVLLAVLVGGGAIGELNYQRARARGGFGIFIVVPLLLVATVVYAIGFGPALALGYFFPLGEAYKLERPPSWGASLAGIAAGFVGGQAAVSVGLAPSHLPVATSNGLAVLSALGLLVVLRILSDTDADRRAAGAAVVEREASFRQLFASNPHPMWVYDEQTLAVLAVNDAAVEAYGFSAEQWMAMRITDIRPESELAALEANLRQPRGEFEQSGIWRHRRADGTLIEVEITSHRTTYLGRPAVLVMAVDVTERSRLERHLRYQALHDDLTGLANRRQINSRLAEQTQRIDGDAEAVVLVALDLDDFHELNVALGNEAGDILLQRVADDLLALAPEALVARIGSDEFALLVVSNADVAETEARGLTAEILDHLTTPIRLGEAVVAVEATAGVAIGPCRHRETSLLSVAQRALSEAKASVGRVEVHDVRVGPPEHPSLAVVAELRHAIEHGDLRLCYQPKVVLATGRVCGFEALVRWQHPKRGLLSPDAFVPLAERTGLVRPLASFVVREAVRQLASWRAQGLDVSVSVNLAASNLTDPGLTDTVIDALREHGCPPERVTLEITESTVMIESDRAASVVRQLSEAGVQISIDDFGTANSSLARLRALPLAEIKLDKTFVKDLDTSWEDSTIVRSSINLAHDLGLEVVAEGVESDEVAEELRRMGCDMAQGYWLSRPLTAADSTDWLLTVEARTA